MTTRRGKRYQAGQAEADRKEVRARIRKAQGRHQLAAAAQRLCHGCSRWQPDICTHGLLPLTLSGGDCPYYDATLADRQQAVVRA